MQNQAGVIFVDTQIVIEIYLKDSNGQKKRYTVFMPYLSTIEGAPEPLLAIQQVAMALAIRFETLTKLRFCGSKISFESHAPDGAAVGGGFIDKNLMGSISFVDELQKTATIKIYDPVTAIVDTSRNRINESHVLVNNFALNFKQSNMSFSRSLGTVSYVLTEQLIAE